MSCDTQEQVYLSVPPARQIGAARKAEGAPPPSQQHPLSQHPLPVPPPAASVTPRMIPSSASRGPPHSHAYPQRPPCASDLSIFAAFTGSPASQHPQHCTVHAPHPCSSIPQHPLRYTAYTPLPPSSVPPSAQLPVPHPLCPGPSSPSIPHPQPFPELITHSRHSYLLPRYPLGLSLPLQLSSAPSLHLWFTMPHSLWRFRRPFRPSVHSNLNKLLRTLRCTRSPHPPRPHPVQPGTPPSSSSPIASPSSRYATPLVAWPFIRVTLTPHPFPTVPRP